MGKEIIIDNKTFLLNVKDEILNEPDYTIYGITKDDIQKFDNYPKLLDKYEDKKYDFESRLSTTLAIIEWIIFLIIGLINGYAENNGPITKYFVLLLLLSSIIFFIDFSRDIIKLISFPITVLPAKLITEMFYKKAPKKPERYDKYKQVEIDREKYKEKLLYQGILYDENGKYIEDILNKAAENLDLTAKNIKSFFHYKNDVNKEKWWYDLDPFKFEIEVAKWYERQGYKADVTKQSGDGGIDIIIKKDNYTGYVQCKHYKSTKISAEIVRQLYGVVKADNVTEGIIVCLSGITEPARDFMKKVNMKFHDVSDLIKNPDKSIKIEQENEDIEKVNNSWIKIGNIQLYTTLCIQESEVNKLCSYLNKCNKYTEYKYIYFRTEKYYSILFGKEDILEDFIKSSFNNYYLYRFFKSKKRRY